MSLDAREKLIVETWLKSFPHPSIAYRLKESFYVIYEAETKEVARQRYFAWFEQITLDKYDYFLPLTMAIEHYGEAIFNYLTYRYSAGYTESLNGLMSTSGAYGSLVKNDELTCSDIFCFRRTSRRLFCQQK